MFLYRKLHLSFTEVYLQFLRIRPLDPSLSLASHVTKLTSTLYFHITSAAYDPSNAHQWCMPCTLSSGPSFFPGWIIAMGSLPKHRTIFWLNCPVWCVLLPDSSSSYLEKVTFLTPSVASSTGLTSRSMFVSNYLFSRVGAFTCRLLHTCLNTVFRSARSPVDHTSGLPHLEICSFQRRTL